MDDLFNTKYLVTLGETIKMRTKGSKNRTPIQILKARLDKQSLRLLKVEIENKKLKKKVEVLQFIYRFQDKAMEGRIKEIGRIIKRLKGMGVWYVE